MCTSENNRIGTEPASIQWSVVRGDTATIKVEFLEDDEITYFDTTDWEYTATAYDRNGDVLDDLDVVSHNGYVEIIAKQDITSRWSPNKYTSVVAELPFDLEVSMPGDGCKTAWTAVIGTIRVLGDVSPGGSL